MNNEENKIIDNLETKLSNLEKAKGFTVSFKKRKERFSGGIFSLFESLKFEYENAIINLNKIEWKNKDNVESINSTN